MGGRSSHKIFKHMIPKKIIIISLDGGTWTVLKPLIERGEMPVIRKLIEKGAYGTMLSSIPCRTGTAVATFYTGKTHCKWGGLNFSAFDANSGEVLWKNKIDKPYVISTACSPDTVIFGRQRLYALDTETGKEQWTIPVRFGHPGSSPIIVGQHVIAIFEHGIYVIDLNTGEIMQELKPDTYKQVLSSPAYYDGFLYVLDSKGNIFAYH